MIDDTLNKLCIFAQGIVTNSFDFQQSIARETDQMFSGRRLFRSLGPDNAYKRTFDTQFNQAFLTKKSEMSSLVVD
ncbi:MAG TPA: hypothetical protein DCL17_07370 [Dehalococcoidia bacterium]|nr:hypothetical protein [Dehalococcoidia bacterium]